MMVNLDTNSLLNEINAVVQNSISSGQGFNQLPKKLIDKSELSEALGISVSAVDGLRRDRIIKGYRIGLGSKSPVRFDLNEVISDIKKHNTL
jgi:hypothetical protein